MYVWGRRGGGLDKEAFSDLLLGGWVSNWQKHWFLLEAKPPSPRPDTQTYTHTHTCMLTHSTNKVLLKRIYHLWQIGMQSCLCIKKLFGLHNLRFFRNLFLSLLDLNKSKVIVWHLNSLLPFGNVASKKTKIIPTKNVVKLRKMQTIRN